MDEFIAAAESYISQHQMIQKGDTVIVALSGGADSMALFHFLFLEQKLLGITLRAAHVDHALRGGASDADAAFVRSQCAARGVPLDETRLSPPAHASEAWARAGRYAFFESLAARRNAKIATAHTASDNAETVLFRLARGSSVRGAAGIPPVRGVFLRPLLWAQRADIEAFLSRCGVPHVTDATNATDAYARNRVRHGVLPLLEEAHPGATRALSRYAAEMAELADFLEAQGGALLRQALLPALPPHTYSASVLAAAPAPVRRAALALVIARCPVPQEKQSLVRAADALVLAGHGSLPLGPGLSLRMEQGRLTVGGDAPVSGTQVLDRSFPLCEGEISLPGGFFCTVRLHKCEEIIKSAKDQKNLLNFFADYDKIHHNAFFRTKRAGDRFCPAGRGVTKPLKKWYAERKIPLSLRAVLPILCRDGVVLWTAEAGFADGVAVDGQTKTAVSITVRRMEERQ